jgi:hypothetical protein
LGLAALLLGLACFSFWLSVRFFNFH